MAQIPIDQNLLQRLSEHFSSLLAAAEVFYHKSDDMDAPAAVLLAAQRSLEELGALLPTVDYPKPNTVVDDRGFTGMQMLYDPKDLQPYVIANLDKRQHIGLGSKGSRSLDGGIDLICLSALLNRGNQTGAVGEFRVFHPLIGSWAGDRIAYVGGSTEEYAEIVGQWENLSLLILRVVLQDEEVGDDYRLYYPEDKTLPSYADIQRMGLP
jgi:hypothetical protein